MEHNKAFIASLNSILLVHPSVSGRDSSMATTFKSLVLLVWSARIRIKM